MERKIHKAILENLPFAYALHKIVLDSEGVPVDYKFIEVNEAFENFTGLDRDNIIEKKATEIISKTNASELVRIHYYGNIAINGGEIEFEQYAKDLQKWYRVKVFSPDIGYFITFFIDITQDIYERNLYKGIFFSLEEGFLATDSAGNITVINKVAEKLIGMKRVNVIQEKIYNVLKNFTEESVANISNKVFHAINLGVVVKEEKVLLTFCENGHCEQLTLLFSIYPIKNSNQDIEGAVISFLDITDSTQKQKEIDYITYHDSLTRVYNRTYFNDEIDKIDSKDNLPISVIMGDLNGLKMTNDAFGHLLGDQLLITAANTMKSICRENDLVIRWGGDEFIILFPKTSREYVQKISERIKAVCENSKIGSVNLSISLGYSTKNKVDEDIMQTINDSEENMYRVKMTESRSQKSKTLKIITQTLKEKSLQNTIHSENVSKLCSIMGKAMKLTEKEISDLEILGDIHDIGKVAIGEALLNKKELLDEEERKEFKKHSEIGYHIALSSPDLSFLAGAILAHHERYDGTGYPNGTKGEEIPFYARLLCIADAFDSMAGYRIYKASMTKEKIIEELKACKGRQFDPEMIDIFIEHVIDSKFVQDTYFSDRC